MNGEFKGLKFFRMDDGRAFELAQKDSHAALLPVYTITAPACDGKAPESDRVIFSHQDDFVSIDTPSRYDLQDAF